jgi:hypothetical protein
MAGNARFHDKHHRTNHHTLSTAGIPDSATDPIASPSQPFQGDFVVNGLLSSSRGLDVLSANYGGDVYCENIHVRDTTYTDFISGNGSETIISDGALTGYGPNTLTLDFGTAIYAKTPIVNFTNSISAASAIYTSFAKFASLSTTNLSSDNVIINSLSVISLSASSITSNSLSTKILSSENITSNSLSSQKISATDVIVTNNLTVSGNCLIYGNLSALGDLTEIETILQTSSAFEISNTDITRPALTITQSGTANSIVVNYDTVPNYLTVDIEGLTINGKVSGLSGVYSPNINTITNTANSVFSTVSSNSANWRSTYSTVSSNSANWESTYSTVSSNSANWESTYSTVSSTSANWVSTNNTVSSNSANWNSVYTKVSGNSANWNSVYTTVSSNSGNWNSAYNTILNDKPIWDETSSIVYFNSGDWDSTYNTVSFNSGNWDTTYSTVSSNSANWESTYSTVSSNSANWESTYSIVSSNSANWESTYSTVSSNSGNWESTYSTVSSNSANWESTYSTVSSNSANWESTKSTVNSNSANWLSGSDTLSFVASSVRTDTLSANILSANIIRVYQAIHVSVSATTVAPGTTTTMTINSPSYYFVNVSSAGTANFNLPVTNGNNRGMLFFIKNVSPSNNKIVSVNNSAGTPLTNGILNGGNTHYIEVVWDGTTWQQISLV